MVCPSLQPSGCHLCTPPCPGAGARPAGDTLAPHSPKGLLLLEPGRCRAPSPVPRDRETPAAPPEGCFPARQGRAGGPPAAPGAVRTAPPPLPLLTGDTDGLQHGAPPGSEPLCPAGCPLRGGLPAAGRGALRGGSARRRGMYPPRCLGGSVSAAGPGPADRKSVV